MVERGVFADALGMQTETKKLTRSTSDRVIAGVAGGIGRYFAIDPAVVRVAFIVLLFFGGAGLIAYGAAWVVVPTDDPDAKPVDAAGIARRLALLAGVVVLTGIAVLVGLFGTADGGATTTAILVIAAGGLLLLGAFTGGMRWLIVPALALACAVGVSAAADLDIRGGTGERLYSPSSADALRSDYRLGIGHLRLDLRNAHLGAGEHRVHVKLGVGGAEVIVPPDVCVSTNAHVKLGETRIFDHATGGTYRDGQETRDARPGAAHLIVDADVGMGQIRVEPALTGDEPQGGACANG